MFGFLDSVEVSEVFSSWFEAYVWSSRHGHRQLCSSYLPMQTWGTPNALQFLKWVTAKDSAPPPTHPFMSRGHILSQELSCHLRLRLGLRLSSYPVISFQGLGGNLKARFASNLEAVCVDSQLFLLPLSVSFSSLVKTQNQTQACDDPLPLRVMSS